MGRKDAKPVVIDLLQDMDKVTLQDLAAKKPQQYRKLADKELNDATVLRTQTGDDLFNGDPEPNKLRAWLSIIALGKKVQPRGMSEIGYKSALQNPYNLSFSEAFGEKHPNVRRSYQRFAALPGSAWKETPRSAGDMSKCTLVNSQDDFRAWLISARRFTSWAGVGLDGVDEQRGGITRYGRDLLAAPKQQRRAVQAAAQGDAV